MRAQHFEQAEALLLIFNLLLDEVFNEFFQLGFHLLRDERLLEKDLRDEAINIGAELSKHTLVECKETYSGYKFNKSIDLVWISPLLLWYSRITPGGW